VTRETGAGFLDALRALTTALETFDAPSMIIGGVAVIAHGVPRLTVDIDASIVAAGLDIAQLETALASHGIRGRLPDAAAFATAHQVFLAAHETSGTPVDVTLAWLPFEEEALAARVRCDYAGVSIHIPRPEDLVVYKLVASRPRDLDDAEGLLVLHGSNMNLERVRRLIGEFARSLDDSERPIALERLIRAAGLAR
jgi:hypothetical protein